ncbi:LOW QUALITY PROTEIN: hypothetical protein ACHAXR_006702 [Thalassiosira sp. AJA248-18]
MVMVDIDSSGILVEPMKSCKDAEMIRSHQALMLCLKRANIVPKKHVLDNEVSKVMKELIRSHYQLELVPPGCHRRNAAEVAIRNFKAHFLSILAGVANDFPMQLWDRLLPQTEITVNILCQSNATPTVSAPAYAHMSGPFDYNKMPLAPMGCNYTKRWTNEGHGLFHSVDGWSLSTSPEHYCTHKCHIKDTKSDRFSDTVHFQHKDITNPTITPHDKLMKALADCAKLLKNVTTTHAAQDIHDLRRISDNMTHAQKSTIPDAHGNTTDTQPSPRGGNHSTPPEMRITRSMATNIPTDTAPVPRVKPTTAQLPIKTDTIAKRRRRVAPHRHRHHLQHQHTTQGQKTMRLLNTMHHQHTTPGQHEQENHSYPNPLPDDSHAESIDSRTKYIEHWQSWTMDKNSGKTLNYPQLMRHPEYKGPWSLSLANEFGRLANGVGGRIKNPTNTIKFIRKEDIPMKRRKDVTYGQFVCSVCPEKATPNQTRFTIGRGDRINYPGEVATPTADMLVAKTLFNSVISNQGQNS